MEFFTWGRGHNNNGWKVYFRRAGEDMENNVEKAISKLTPNEQTLINHYLAVNHNKSSSVDLKSFFVDFDKRRTTIPVFGSAIVENDVEPTAAPTTMEYKTNPAFHLRDYPINLLQNVDIKSLYEGQWVIYFAPVINATPFYKLALVKAINNATVSIDVCYHENMNNLPRTSPSQLRLFQNNQFDTINHFTPQELCACDLPKDARVYNPSTNMYYTLKHAYIAGAQSSRVELNNTCTTFARHHLVPHYLAVLCDNMCDRDRNFYMETFCCGGERSHRVYDSKNEIGCCYCNVLLCKYCHRNYQCEKNGCHNVYCSVHATEHLRREPKSNSLCGPCRKENAHKIRDDVDYEFCEGFSRDVAIGKGDYDENDPYYA